MSAGDPDHYTDTVTHLRIFQDGGDWQLDGADDQLPERNFTQACWSFDTHAQAVAAMTEFVENQTKYCGVRFLWRDCCTTTKGVGAPTPTTD